MTQSWWILARWKSHSQLCTNLKQTICSINLLPTHQSTNPSQLLPVSRDHTGVLEDPCSLLCEGRWRHIQLLQTPDSWCGRAVFQDHPQVGLQPGKQRGPIERKDGVHSELRAMVNVGLELDTQRFQAWLCHLLAVAFKGSLPFWVQFASLTCWENGWDCYDKLPIPEMQ